MPVKFMVELVGSFYTYELYNERGRYIFDLDEAVNEAETQYGDEWVGVFNGSSSMSREEYLVLRVGSEATQ